MTKTTLPKYVYSAYDGQLVRAEIDDNGLSGWLDFGRPVPKGETIHTVMSDDPDLTLEQVTGAVVVRSDISGKMRAFVPNKYQNEP